MQAIPLLSYSDFKASIPDRFRITKGPAKGRMVADFREAIGEQALRFRRIHMQTTGGATHRHNRWRVWLEAVPFDDDVWKILNRIDDDTISTLKKDQANIEFYTAIFYRFHAVLDDTSFADAIDKLVFGRPLREQGRAVFIRDTKPTAPFIHPPYVSESYVKRRLEEDPTDGIWLNPHNHHSIKLSGRQIEMEHLDSFMSAKETFLICPVIAPSGAGKTRLISEWMKPYVPSVSATDWDAGFVISRDAQPWKEWIITRNTLIVIDYTFAYGEVVSEIARRARVDGSGRRIRLIVIDHVFPEELFKDVFWQRLYGSPSIEQGQHSINERFETLTIEPEGDQSTLLPNIIAAVVHNGGDECGKDDSVIANAIAALSRMAPPGNPGAVRHPLFAALAGHALRSGRDITHWNRQELIKYYFSTNDRLPWKVWMETSDRKRWGLAVGALVSAATLRRGLPLSRVKRKLPGDPDAIIQYAGRIVSAGAMRDIKPFEPDLLGETFTFKFLAELQNWESDESKRAAYDLFISILHTSEEEGDGSEIARNFFETVSRSARNLLNDDQHSEDVIDTWNVLDNFLEPQQFIAGSILRYTISIVRADVVSQCFGAGQSQRARQFAEKIEIESIEAASSGILWIQAAMKFMNLIEFRLAHRAINDDEIPSFSIIDRNIRSQSNERFSSFLVAVFEGCVGAADIARQEFHEDVNASGSDGWTALMVSANCGRIEMLRRLLNLGADVHHSGMDNRWTALMAACLNGHTEIASLLLEKGASVNQRTTDDGKTALLAACARGHSETAALLLDKGASVDQGTTDDGRTALMEACIGGHTATAALLLDRGASVDQGTTDNGRTALMEVCARGDTATATLLLDRGASVLQGTTDGGSTALIAACAKGHTGTASLLLDRGANVNQGTTDDGRTALMPACAGGHTKTVALLLDRGAIVNQGTTDDGRTALMGACAGGHTGTVALLLEKGANINQGTTDGGITALMAACAKGHQRTVALLLEKGADANQRTTFGMTAIVYSVQSGAQFSGISELLLKWGANEADLFC